MNYQPSKLKQSKEQSPKIQQLTNKLGSSSSSQMSNVDFQRKRDMLKSAPAPPKAPAPGSNNINSFNYINNNNYIINNSNQLQQPNFAPYPFNIAPPENYIPFEADSMQKITDQHRARLNNGMTNANFQYQRNININNVQAPPVRGSRIQTINPNKISNNQLFNDDDPLEIKETDLEQVKLGQTNYNVEKGLNFELKPIQKAIKLSSKNTTIIPAMISLTTLDSTEESTIQRQESKEQLQNRPGVDLICVIDKSGSMAGEKMNLVQSTLQYMLELLNEGDRICIIEFANNAQRLTKLLKVSQKNIPEIIHAIDFMKAAGGTSIQSGMDLAFRSLKDRKFKNSVSSIFLLSDGLDNNAETKVASNLINYGLTDNFTIQTFGFGSDHDAKLMGEIAKLKNGNFYFIEKLEMVDESFVDALGGLFSVIAQEVKINLKINRNKPFTDHNIKKTYGNMWQYNSITNQYSLAIEQLMCGVSKEFIFEIALPPCPFEIGDHQRNAVLVTASLECRQISQDDQAPAVQKTAEMLLTIYNENEIIPPDSEGIDENVQFNIFRVRGAEALEEAMKHAEINQFEEGQKQIDSYLNELKFAKPSTQNKLGIMVNDLKIAKESCKPQIFEEVGAQRMYNMKECHWEQKSNNLNGYSNNMYSNNIQKVMNVQLQSKQM